MSAALESDEGGWLSRLFGRNKRRQSGLSSPGLASRPSQEAMARAVSHGLAGAAAAAATSATVKSPAPEAKHRIAGGQAEKPSLASVTEAARPRIADPGAAPSSPDPVSVASPAPQRPQPASGGAALAALRNELGAGALYTFIFAPDFVPFSVREGIEHALVGDESGFTRLRMARGDEKTSPGGNNAGYCIRLPDEIEKLASGRPIELRLLARSTTGAAGRVACCYSTNEVGNSGWRWLNFGPEWEIKSFNYAVPKMRVGRGDFIGLLPPPDSEPVTEIMGLAIVIGS